MNEGWSLRQKSARALFFLVHRSSRESQLYSFFSAHGAEEQRSISCCACCDSLCPSLGCRFGPRESRSDGPGSASSNSGRLSAYVRVAPFARRKRAPQATQVMILLEALLAGLHVSVVLKSESCTKSTTSTMSVTQVTMSSVTQVTMSRISWR